MYPQLTSPDASRRKVISTWPADCLMVDNWNNFWTQKWGVMNGATKEVENTVFFLQSKLYFEL